MPGYQSNPLRLLPLVMLALPCLVHAAQAQAHEPSLSDPIPLLAGAGDMSAGTPPVAPRRAVRYVWRINNGDKISDAFRAWARQSKKWQVVWEAPELVSQAAVDVDGNFEDAVSKVIEALNRGDAQLIARFYVDSANSVLRVMEKK